MTVSIASVTLRAFEIPAAIRYGTSHRVVVHQLGSGRRVLETLGSDALDISFSGILSGPDAAAQASILTELCESGQTVPLVWGSNYRDVVVKRFSAEYVSSGWIPYELTCVVSEGTGQTTPSTEPGVAKIAADIQSAVALGTTWSAELAAIPTLLSTAVSPSQLNDIRNRIAGVCVAIDAEMAASAGTSATADLSSNTPPEHLAKAAALLGYLRRSLKLIENGT